MLALACTLVATALPGMAHAQVPLQDSAAGAGHVLLTDFAGATEAGPNGEDPVGSLTVTGYLDFTTTTTCFNVAGNAVVSGHRIETGPRAGEGFISATWPLGARPGAVRQYWVTLRARTTARRWSRVAERRVYAVGPVP